MLKHKYLILLFVLMANFKIMAQEAVTAVKEPQMYEKMDISPTTLFMVMVGVTLILVLALVSVSNTLKNVIKLRQNYPYLNLRLILFG